MINLSLTAGTAASTLAITAVDNTNTNLTISNNQVSIQEPGFYEIVGQATLTSSAAESTGINVAINGTTVGNSAIFSASASSITDTVPVYYIANVASSSSSGFVTVSFTPVGTPTVVGGTISIKKIT